MQTSNRSFTLPRSLLRLRPALAAAAPLIASLAPPTRGAAPDAASDQVVQLSPFVLNEAADHGYGTTNSVGASRIAIAVEDLPTTIISVNRELINDTGATELIDAIRWTSGVAVAAAPLNGQFSLRGQNTSAVPLRDGLPVAVSGVVFPDLTTVERIEIIKGPAGSLYGVMSTGGLVNEVSKQPLGVRRSTITQSVASTNGHQISHTELDTTGPVDAAGKLRYRVLGSMFDGRTYYNRIFEREVISPVLTYNPVSTLQFFARYEYQFDNEADQACPWFADPKGQISTFIPRDDVADDPWESYRNWREYTDLGIDKSLFSSHWDTRLTFRASHSDSFWEFDQRPGNGVLFYDTKGNLIGPLSTPSLDFSNPAAFGSIIQEREWTKMVNLERDMAYYWDNVIQFSAGPTAHKLLIYGGFDRNAASTPYYVNAAIANTPLFDYLHPVYYTVFNPNNVPLVNSSSTYSDGSLLDYGAQDNISLLNDRIVLVGGWRRDKVLNNNINNLTHTVANQDGQGTSFKAGVVGKVVNGVSLFYNHATTFTPQFGTYFVDPTLVLAAKQNLIGTMNEEGIKFELFDGRLVATGSYFDITTSNSLGTGPIITNIATSLPLGLVTTPGWEEDFAYQPIPAISIVGGTGNLNSKTATGLYARNVPVGFNYKTFVKYSLLNGNLRGLSVGAGYDYVAHRAGDAASDFMLPAYGIWHVMAAYDYKQWTFRINVDNLLDKIYAASSAQNYLIWPGTPRTLQFTVRRTF